MIEPMSTVQIEREPKSSLVNRSRPRLWQDLSSPRDVFSHFGPNWFAAVMGTGIVANGAMLIPIRGVVLRDFALAFWVAATAMLALFVLLTALHWIYHPQAAKGHALDPEAAQFYGAPPMAFLTVAAGSLLVGRYLIGLHAALPLDWVLWTIGTLTGLVSTFLVPYLMFTTHEIDIDRTLGSWIVPIVPPMVSAATGAPLIAHVPAGPERTAFLLALFAMFGISLFIALIIFALLWGRLVYRGVGPAQTVPTVWIGLGPLGQSITAANLIGAAAHKAIAAPYAQGLKMMELLYGIPVFGFAMLWLAIALAITVRTARRHLPFSFTFWSFTFPVGTCVTGTSELALHTGLVELKVVAVALFGLLLVGWFLAARGTFQGVWRGWIFLPPHRQPLARPAEV